MIPKAFGDFFNLDDIHVGADHSTATPSPEGRGSREAAGEGCKMKNNEETFVDYRLFTFTARVETPLMVNVYIAFPSTLI
jgi:hypothetical protein